MHCSIFKCENRPFWFSAKPLNSTSTHSRGATKKKQYYKKIINAWDLELQQCSLLWVCRGCPGWLFPLQKARFMVMSGFLRLLLLHFNYLWSKTNSNVWPKCLTDWRLEKNPKWVYLPVCRWWKNTNPPPWDVELIHRGVFGWFGSCKKRNLASHFS